MKSLLFLKKAHQKTT